MRVLMELPAPTCAACAAPLAADQRYCLECGARHGAPRLDPVFHARGREDDATAEAVAPAPVHPVPRPRTAAALTLAMVVAGVALGAAGSPDRAASAPGPMAARRVVLLQGPPAVAALPATPLAAADRGEPDVAVEEPAVDDAPAAEEVPDAAPEAEAPAGPVDETAPETDTDTPDPTPVPEAPDLPPVTHVWVVALADRGLTRTFGPGSPDPWFREELVRQGLLLNNLHATARGTLANGIALLTGQGANAASDGDCAQPDAVTPGTVPAGDPLQQVQGDGCVYPSTVGSLPEQLTGAGKPWKAYVEDLPTPAPGAAPDCTTARTPRNPFAYLAALTDAPDCAAHVVPTSALAADLAAPERTPALSWIVPGACHDGRETPCAPGAPADLAAAGAWLRPVLDQIRATKAYQEGGLIVLLADRGARDPGALDLSTRKGAPNGQGGGLVPGLLLSPFVVPGQQVAAAYDHFSVLASLEDLFGLPRLGQAGRPGLRAFGPRVFAAPRVTG